MPWLDHVIKARFPLRLNNPDDIRFLLFGPGIIGLGRDGSYRYL